MKLLIILSIFVQGIWCNDYNITDDSETVDISDILELENLGSPIEEDITNNATDIVKILEQDDIISETVQDINNNNPENTNDEITITTRT